MSLQPRTVNVLMSVTGLLLAIVIGEVTLRLGGVSYPILTQIDGDLGASLRPGAEGWWRREGEAYIRINSAGLRDREHTLHKPIGHFRIAVLGDSYAEALQVPQEETFWAVLERELVACPSLGNRTPEVINFGVSGYGTAQELLMLRRKVWPYSPDLVLLTVTTGNDIRNNSALLERDPKKPYFRLNDGRLEEIFPYRDSVSFRLRQSLPGTWLYRLWNSSRIAQLLSEVARRSYAPQEAASQPDNIGGFRPEFDEAGLDSAVYKAPQDEAWTDAWAVTEALLRSIRDDTRSHQVPLVIATLSNSVQVHPNPAVRRAVAESLGILDLFYPDDRIRDFARREGLAVMTLVPKLQAYAEERGEFLHGFDNSGLGHGHWNRLGHGVAGELLAQGICRSLSAQVAEFGDRPAGSTRVQGMAQVSTVSEQGE